MLRINLYICTFMCAIVLTLTNTILGQASSFLRKPWPTYSLQNMPQTRFTCHDKILGGYYADPETQCQMFHVCVKVAGVGVQDFRFLCPNGTAFDQEAQICADWGDVDCEQSVLYYGSDNFDLYRLASGFESKRAPLAEEDESTFHLQRAESGDVRRFKETRVDQKSRPDQPPNYTKHFETVTRGNFNSNTNNNNKHNYKDTQQHVKTKKQKQQTEVTKKPIVSYYTPTSTTTTRTSTTTTTERNYNDDSKQDLDDIFKGSHSSHFFSNRNGGREDDFIDHAVKPSLKPNDFSDFSRKSEASTIGKSRVTPTRPKRPLQTSTTIGSFTKTTNAAPKTVKKGTQNSYYNTDVYDFSQYRSTTPASHSYSTTHNKTPRPVKSQSNANRFNIGLNDYQTQAKIQPTTYNPNRYKSSTTKYTEFKREKVETNSYNKPAGSNKKAQKIEQTQQKLNPQNSTFVKLNEFDEFVKIKPQPPQPFQVKPPSKIFKAPARTSIEPQYYRSRGQSQARINNQQPEPFRSPQRQTVKSTENLKEKPTVAVKVEAKPRGFASRGSINYKATTQRDSETYPTTSSNNHKKFSTLVPKDKHSPTTFKPSTYKKTYENNFYQNQQTIKPSNQLQKSQTASTTTTLHTTANPYYNPDEDDGQYHPELYEIDYSRNNFNRQRQTSSSTTTSIITSSTTTKKPIKQNYNNPVNHLKSQQQTSYLKEQTAAGDLSEEDELFKTAQSLNFGAASINKLRADIFKAEKTSQQYNSQYNPHNTISSSKTTTTSTTPYSTTTTYFTSIQTTPRTTQYALPSTTSTTTTTTRRPTTQTAINTTKYTTAYPYSITKSGKHTDKLGKKAKNNENKNKKKTSKRPPHADEDTSYDYAYYDSDTLSESPQEYHEYEIQEFTKTKKN